ncbi:bifunctional diaminohydroxyphosphoribosylaminopyrimidine deaminase/5-amino-6-(5-phosphoribosylamino)uracil reductase RibD [Flaviaesturariibacter amylovorans]|uniref:Riboflavin biosynthesis protein RibD n=1 Tax=Flaviaesturariibacter amylovorans TaxID=1084520 RepID=A0ABP8GMW8_9BACT
MLPHDTYMLRCLQLARNGRGAVAPNPMVGAVLVHGDRIIGEGWHRRFGGVHAEVECLESVREEDKPLIAEATLYVSLEPCAHFGKTPPCADLVIRHAIPRVVVGCRDPFPLVAGKGIEKLRAAGVDVTVGILEGECRALNSAFFTFHTEKRPFITLKWAQSADGQVAGLHGRRAAISGALSARLTHRLRATHAGILVGTNTALFDDPELSTRHWPGAQPLRIVLDRRRRLPVGLRLFSGDLPTLVLNEGKNERHHGLEYVHLDGFGSPGFAERIVQTLHARGLQSLLVEGGAQLLQCFIDSGLWDETLVLTNTALRVGSGIPAPQFSGGVLLHSRVLGTDRADTYRKAEGSLGRMR